MAAGSVSEVGRMLLGGRIGGRHSSPLAAARAGLRVEVGELRKLNKEFDVIRQGVAALRKEMDALSASSAKAAGSARSAVSSGAGAGTGSTSFPAGTPRPPLPPPPPPPAGGAVGGGALSSLRSMLGGVAGAAGGGGGLGAMAGRFLGGPGALPLSALAAGQVAGNMMAGLDRRIDRGMNYASDVDRLNVMLQQRTGLSQMGVMNQMRKPLANYRIGTDGISSILQFQSQYGTQMQGGMPQMAASIAGIRAMSGYTKTTADVLQDQTSLQDPRVANRMFNMLGVNAYTQGGEVNDPVKMRQQLTQTLGLNDPTVMRGAKMQGSAVRAMMTDSGIPLEVQDEILGYAETNIQFRNKTGNRNAMYDPRKEEDRRTMGIEENFATQQEETERLRTTRDENFTRRQIDNMASLERSNQSLIKALGAVEDKLSALVGARTSSRSWGSLLGRGMQLGGLAMMATGFGAAAGAGMVVAGGALAGGDPVDAEGPGAAAAPTRPRSDSTADDRIAIPVGYGGQRKTLNEVKQRADFKALKPQMQERLLSMFRENPNVGIGQGSRNSRDQETMFKSRYRRTERDTGIFWDGSFWEHVSGAAAAPPGRSMHEIGLAADLIGDLAWMNANASRFGLKHFAGVNNEPWHVQPAELPNSRREYEGGGAAWGTDNVYGGEDKSGTQGPVRTTTGASVDEHPEDGNIGGMSIRSFAGMSVDDIIKTMAADAQGRMGTGGPGAYSGRPGAGGSSGTSVTPVTGGSLKGEDVARAAFGAGFRADQLIKMVAIAKRESRWNPRAYNGNLSTGDQSYGLWQLNTLNSEKGGRMGDLFNQFLGKPQGNKDFDELFDPNTNARGAKFLSDRNGGTLKPWGGYKGMSDTHGADQYMGEAAQAVSNAQLGDPMPPDRHGAPSPIRSSTHVSHAPTYQISISPVINFHGQPQTPDLRRIAQEVGSLLREEVRTLEMRKA